MEFSWFYSRRTSIRGFLDDTGSSRTNLPLTSVAVPSNILSSLMVTPGMGSPFFVFHDTRYSVFFTSSVLGVAFTTMINSGLFQRLIPALSARDVIGLLIRSGRNRLWLWHFYRAYRCCTSRYIPSVYEFPGTVPHRSFRPCLPSSGIVLGC